MTVATLPNGGRKTPLVMQVKFKDPDLLMKLPGAVVGYVKSADPQRLGNGTAKGRYHQQGVSLEQDLMKYIRRAGADKIRLSTLVEIIDRYLRIEPDDEEAMMQALKRKPSPVTNPLAVEEEPWDQGPLYTKRLNEESPDSSLPSLYQYDWDSHEWEEPMTHLALYPHHIKGKSMPEAYKVITQALWRLNRDAASQFFAEVQEWVFECETPTWHEFILIASQYAYLVPHSASSSAVDPHRAPF